MQIRSMRKDREITQEQLCHAIGVSRSAVAMWETGRAKPRADLIPKIAETLGCSIEELFNDREAI